MAIQIKRGGGKGNQPQREPQPPSSTDPLRDIAGVKRSHAIPIFVLIFIFAVVEVIVVWLMWPQFSSQWTAFRGRRYAANGQPAKALPYLLKLATDHPDSPTFNGEAANVYMQLKQYDEAIKYFQIAQENRNNIPADDNGNKPEATDFNIGIGTNYFQKGDMPNAEKYLKLALAHNKLDSQANFLLGRLEFQRKNYTKAAEYFKMVAANPSFKEEVRKYYGEIEQKMFARVQD